MFTAVTSTKIFCNDQCPAQPPKKQNRLILPTVRDCLAIGCRPCKRCKPLHIDGGPKWLTKVLARVEDDSPHETISPSKESLARWFKTNHQITFDALLRMRRLAKEIGTTWCDAKSPDRIGRKKLFEELLQRKAATLATRERVNSVLVNRIVTPLGPMVVFANQKGIVLLEFAERRMLETQIVRVARIFDAQFRVGVNDMMRQLDQEFQEYFAGQRREFEVPLVDLATEFQNAVWGELVKIPAGKTATYQKIATKLKKPKAVRAVGRANGDNRFTILVPCHRVIGSDGSLTGYGGGLDRKQWLLDHEKKIASVRQATRRP
jgi:AraC family transcriptional regulator of adaptative response/methylated-DNA-[protein]-cysteine methyltransferase